MCESANGTATTNDFWQQAPADVRRSEHREFEWRWERTHPEFVTLPAALGQNCRVATILRKGKYRCTNVSVSLLNLHPPPQRASHGDDLSQGQVSQLRPPALPSAARFADDSWPSLDVAWRRLCSASENSVHSTESLCGITATVYTNNHGFWNSKTVNHRSSFSESALKTESQRFTG